MTTLYVPEIGDSIRLTSDWTFKLHRERRNGAMMELVAGLLVDKNGEEAKVRRRVKKITPLAFCYEDKEVPNFNYPHFSTEKFRIAPVRKILDQALFDEMWSLNRQLDHWGFDMTLPAGTVLTVDRIYIRQGAKEYSSISFYIEETTIAAIAPKKKGKGGFAKGRTRFWAKLADCNRIEFASVV